MDDETQIGICPRCGLELVREFTASGKVCFRCPSCGGVSVTLPVLRESLGARSVATLVRAARAAEHVGCPCPGCGGSMSLLKVGDGKDKLEIDVCGRCLCVWCDKGEYETLAPPPPKKQGDLTMRRLLERMSPEARERYAAVLSESLQDDVSPEDFDIGDILRDVARLVIGAPTLWRRVRPVSPIFAILLTIALPVAQACIFYGFYDLGHAMPSYYSRYHEFWRLGPSVLEKTGFAISSPLTVLTFPFVQESGRWALICAIMLFVPFAVIERRIGHARFLGLFFLFVAVSAVAQTFFVATWLAEGRLCGIAPIALGMLAYASCAWPDLHIKGEFGLMSVYSGVVGLFILAITLLTALAVQPFSFGFGPVAACLALGAFLGRRAKLKPCY